MPRPAYDTWIRQCFKAVFPCLESNFNFHPAPLRKSQSKRYFKLVYNQLRKSLKVNGF
jgi:hypothetical protein